MSWVAAAVVGSSLISGYMGSKASKDAANKTLEGTKYAADINKEMYDISRQDLAPYREAGYAALTDINALKPHLTSTFGGEQLAKYLDPSMDFRMKYGGMATERQQNVGQGLISGNTLRALTDYGQNLASTEYGNAFNRFQTDRGNIYSILGNIAGLGSGAVNTGVQASQQTAQNLGTLAIGGAQAQAAGTVGSANAWSNALQGPTNYFQLSSLLGRNPFATPGTTPGVPAPSQAYAPQAATTSIA